MQENAFYAIYVERTGEVVAFHNLPLEQVDQSTSKVAFTCEGVSFIVVRDDLEKYKGKEREYIVKASELTKRPLRDVKREGLQINLGNLKREIKTKISAKVDVGKELQITKDYLEWIRNGQPQGDDREKAYLEMQAIINKIKSEYADKKLEIMNELRKLEE